MGGVLGAMQARVTNPNPNPNPNPSPNPKPNLNPNQAIAETLLARKLFAANRAYSQA